MVISLTDRTKQLGPLLKIVICLCVLPVLLVLCPIFGILGSIVGGAAYGFLSPIFATFEAVEEGKDDKLYHCFIVCSLCFISGLDGHYHCFTVINFRNCTKLSGWYLEHCSKGLHGCKGCKRRCFPFVLFSYG